MRDVEDDRVCGAVLYEYQLLQQQEMRMHKRDVMDEPDKVVIKYNVILEERLKAWRFEIDEKRVWLPKSQCELDEDNLTVTVPERLADRNCIYGIYKQP